MQDLKDIVKILPYDNLEEFGSKISDNLLSPKKKELYNILKVENDIDIDVLNQLMYQNQSKATLQRLANRLKEQLLDGLFFLEIERFSKSTFNSSVLKLYKRFATTKILQEWEYNELNIKISSKLVLDSLKYEQYELALLVAQRMEFHYSFISYDNQLARKYGSIFETCLEKITLTRKVSRLYYMFAQMVISGKISYSIEELRMYDKEVEDLRSIQESNQSLQVNQRIFSILYLFHLLKKDYPALLDFGFEALKFYERFYPDRSVEIFLTRLRIGVAYLYLQEYEEARHFIKGLDDFGATPGKLHWNSAKSYRFILEMITKNYQQAADIHHDVITEKALKKLGNMWLQQWNIRSAYIHFLSKIGLVDLEAFGKKRVPNFRLGKFLNEVPHYSKDKRGLNISIIIAQFLILLADKRYDEIYDRIDALSKYSYRHLKNDTKLRSNCFIRMLLTLPRADFHPIRAERYAKKYIDKLKTTELNLNEYSTEIEIIPYEHLWEIITDLLSKRKIKGYQSVLAN